jgi:hypothetical protein
MSPLSPQVILAAGALAILGGIGAAMLVLPIPPANAQSVTFILGALAGALTMQGSVKAPPSPVPPPAGDSGALKDPQV